MNRVWRAKYIEDFNDVFIFYLGLCFKGLFWERYTLKHFEGPNCVWRALKTSIWSIVCEYYSVCYFMSSNLLIKFTYKNLWCNKQIYGNAVSNRTSSDLVVVIEVHVCWHLNYIYRFFQQLHSFLNVEQFIKFEGIVQYHLNTCLYNVFSLILS